MALRQRPACDLRSAYQRTAQGCALVAALGWQATASAQAAGEQVLAQVETLNKFEAEQERLRQRMANQTQGYQDRYFDPQDLGAIVTEEAASAPQPAGIRSILVEARHESSRQSTSGEPGLRDDGFGLGVEYRVETMNHGEWVLQADARQRSGRGDDLASLGAFALPTASRSGQRFTLRNQAFPITPFVLADANLGDISSEVTDGITRGQQFSLGSSSVRGASAQVFARGFDLRVGAGARGQWVGGPFPSYEKTQGRLAWLGGTQRFDNGLFAALQVNQASGVPGLSDTAQDPAGAQRSTSVAAAVGRGAQLVQDGDTRVRLTAIRSRTSTEGVLPGTQRASGLYLDGGLVSGRQRWETGLYGAKPQLNFGDQTVSSGNRGWYGRFHRSDLRSQWGLGLTHDLLPAEANGTAADWRQTGFSAYGSQRLGRLNSWGGTLQQVRQQRQTRQAGERSTYGSLYYLDRWHRALGDSRLQWTTRNNQALVSNGPRATGDELSWEQDWWPPQEPGAQNPVLRTQLGWARDRSLGDTITYPTAGLTWQTFPGQDWSIDTVLRYSSRQGNLATSRGLSGSVQIEKRVSPQWTAGASLLMNQAQVNVAGSAAEGGAVVSRSNDRAVWVFLRYESQLGRPYATGLRGAQGAGTGRIAGTVFLDANQDGIQQSDEPGVPGVEVFLNLRQRDTTDSRGRYEFADVPTGPQFLSLRPESVPLPWGEGPSSRRTVEVPLRGAVAAPLAVVKESE